MAAAVLACALSGLWFYRREARDIRARKHNELRAIAELKTGQLLAWREERLHDARMFSVGPLKRAILGWTAAPGDASLRDSFRAQLRLLRDEEGYQNIVLAAPDGKVRLTLGTPRAALDAAAWQTAARALSSRRIVMGDLIRCPVCAQVHLDVAVPLFGPGGRAAAVLVLRRDPERFLYPLIQSWPVPSRSAETVLVRREGGDVVFLNKLRHRPEEALSLRIPISRTDVPAVQAVLGRTGVFEGKDYRGTAVLTDVRPVPGTPWFMVAKVDADELLAELRYRGRVIASLILLGGLALGGLAVLAHNIRQRRLYQDLDRSRRERDEARDEVRATLYGIGDGVIAADREGRVTRLNPVAERLTGWSEAAARGRPLREVFRIVNEESRAAVETPVQKVLREGKVVGLANHTVLISRDGSERPIADSGAPIHGPGGGVVGVVLVFRDQSQERASRRALAESTARYQALFANMVNGFAYCRMLFDDGHPEDFVYLETNRAFETLTGLKDVAGKKVSEVIPGIREADPELFERYGRVARTGAPERFETYVSALRMWFDISVYSPERDHFVAVFDVITDRKRSEEALLLHSAIIENMSEGAHLVRMSDRTIIYANRKLGQLFGYGPDELIGRDVSVLSAPGGKTPDETTKGILDILARTGEWHGEVRNVKKDGSIFICQAHCSAFEHPRIGKVSVSVHNDITESKRLDSERDLSLQLLRLLNEASDLRGLMRDVAELLQGWTGCEAVGIRLRDGEDFPYFETRGFPAEFVRLENTLCARGPAGELLRNSQGDPIVECMCGNVLCGRFDPSKAFFTTRGSFWSNGTTELLARTTEADRQTRTRNRCNGEGYESVALIALRSGGSVHGLLQFNDRRKGRFAPETVAVLERVADSLAVAVAHRQALAELRRSELELCEAQAQARLGAWRVSFAKGGETWRGSEEFLRIYGHPLGTRLSMETGMAAVHPDDRGHVRERWAAALRGEGPSEWEHRIVVDGGVKWMHVRAAFRRDASGRVVDGRGTSQDITELKTLQEQLLQAQKMESVGRLAGGVAHDFNNLLTAINGYAEFLMRGLPEGDPRRDDVKEILAAGARAAGLTRQLLAFSRKQILKPQLMDLNAVVGGTVKMLKRLIGEDVKLETGLAARPCPVMVDGGQVEQVLLNLAVNARDAMPKGGTLTIETRLADMPEAFFRDRPGLKPGPLVLLRVADTGAGMDGSVKEHLFEPFFTTKERGKGTGLGLSMVYGIVKQSGGDIAVESAPARGTVFLIYFPLCRETPAPAAGTAASPALRGSETVLLVEDEETVRGLVHRILSNQGYAVLEASDGAGALKALEGRGAPVDILVTDVVMPGGNGRELARQVVARCPGAKVLYMSGYTDDAIVRHGMLEPGLAFIYKPFTAEALALKVREVLDGPAEHAKS